MCTPRSPWSSGALASIALAARRRTLNVPIRLTRITVSNGTRPCAPLRPATFSAWPMPAQQTEIRRPSSPAACVTAASTCSASVTSAVTNRAPSSSASAWPRSGLRSAMVTLTPAACSARAVAAPRPDAPPATSAFTPSIFMARKLAEANGAGRCSARAEHVVARELRDEAQPGGEARAELDLGVDLADAVDGRLVRRDRLGALLGADRDRAGAALGRGDDRRAGQLALQAERVGRLAVAARPHRGELELRGGEAADGYRADDARRLARAVDGHRDQRVTADVAAPRRVGALE